MQTLLLLGAGFSRNWGGSVASEVFEYLLGTPELKSNVTIRAPVPSCVHADCIA